MPNVSLTRRSSNIKTGKIPTTTSSATTCPDSCPLKEKGCYAKAGFYTSMHWNKVTEGERGMNYASFCAGVSKFKDGQLWRHNVAGDLFGENNEIDRPALVELTKANKDKRGFTYTHKPVLLSQDKKWAAKNRTSIKAALKGGFTINLSADNYKEADKFIDLKIAPVVTLMPSTATKNEYTPKGRKIVVCPATQSDTVTCATCQLCQRADRSAIIGFPAHGTATKTVNEIIEAS